MFVDQDWWYVCGLGLVVFSWTSIDGMFVDQDMWYVSGAGLNGGMFVDYD